MVHGLRVIAIRVPQGKEVDPLPKERFLGVGDPRRIAGILNGRRQALREAQPLIGEGKGGASPHPS